MKSVAPVTGVTVTSAGPAIITRLLISGEFCELAPVLRAIWGAVRTFLFPPFSVSPCSVTATTARSVPPCCEKFVILRKWSSGTVITRGELIPVIILLLKGLANAKLAATRITKAITHRTVSVFMVQEIHTVLASASSKWLSGFLRRSAVRLHLFATEARRGWLLKAGMVNLTGSLGLPAAAPDGDNSRR